MSKKTFLIVLFLLGFEIAYSQVCLRASGRLVLSNSFVVEKTIPNKQHLLAYYRYGNTFTVDTVTYLRDLSGNKYHLPIISGTSYNTIVDLNAFGDRFNKKSYLGNSYGKPEYYDYPYTTIYFDTANASHWKLSDFHYRILEDQRYSGIYTNSVYARLTYSSSVLQSVDEIMIYDTTLSYITNIRNYTNITPVNYYKNE